MTDGLRLVSLLGVAAAVLWGAVAFAAEPAAPRGSPSADVAPLPQTDGSAPSAASTPEGEGGGEAKKSPGAPGGYSWTDKPARRARRARALPRHPAGAPVATFPGFRVLADGSSVVWVTVSKRVAYEVFAAGHQVTVRLPGTYVDVRNNTNPLVTDHFPTRVRSVRLRPDKEGTSLVVELRQAATAQPRVHDGPGGTMTIELAFAPGDSPARQTSESSAPLSIRSGTPPSAPRQKARRTGTGTR